MQSNDISSSHGFNPEGSIDQLPENIYPFGTEIDVRSHSPLPSSVVDEFMKSSSNSKSTFEKEASLFENIKGEYEPHLLMIKDPSELDMIAGIKADKLQDRLDDYYTFSNQAFQVIEAERELLQLVVKEKIEGFKKSLEGLQKQMLENIQEHISKKQERVKRILEEDKVLEKSVKDKIFSLRTKDYHQHLTEDLPIFNIRKEYIMLINQNRVYDKEFYSKALDDQILPLMAEIKRMKFPDLKFEEKAFIIKEGREQCFDGKGVVFFNLVNNPEHLEISFEGSGVENKISLTKLGKVNQVNLELNKNVYKNLDELICILDCFWGYLENLQHVTFFFKKGGLFVEKLRDIVSLQFCNNHKEMRTSCEISNLLTDESNLRVLLTKILPKIPSLRFLKLSLPKSKLNDNLLKAFVESNALTFQNIESFKVNFSETLITDEALVKLLGSIKTANHLHFCLDSTRVTDNFTRELMKIIHQGMRNLKSFGLHLKNTQVQESIGLLGDLSQLSKLSLDFSDTPTRFEDIESFALNVLPNMVFLQHFELYLSKLQSRQLPDELAQKLFTKMPKLRVLCIDLSQNGAKAYSLEGLMKKTCDFSGELQHLELSLNDCQIQDDGIKRFFMRVPRTLKTLALHLENNFQITNSIFDVFKNSFSVGKEFRLESFELALTNNQKITGEGFIDLLNQIKKTVRILTLNIEGTEIKKHFLVGIICHALSVDENLECLKIDANNGLGVMEKDLSNAFMKSQKTKCFSLHMGSQVITEKSIRDYQNSPKKK